MNYQAFTNDSASARFPVALAMGLLNTLPPGRARAF
jgi:hypothetical protein